MHKKSKTNELVYLLMHKKDNKQVTAEGVVSSIKCHWIGFAAARFDICLWQTWHLLNPHQINMKNK